MSSPRMGQLQKQDNTDKPVQDMVCAAGVLKSASKSLLPPHQKSIKKRIEKKFEREGASAFTRPTYGGVI